MEEAELMANPDLLKPLSRSKRQELATLTRSELEERVISLEKHVQQLRNVIAKHTGSSMPQVQTIIFVFDPEQIASRYGRSFKLTSSTLIGLRDAMSCSGFLISDGTTWVSPPRRMLASRLSQNCLQRCSRLSLSKVEKSQITTGA